MHKKTAWAIVIIVIVALAGYAAYAKHSGTLPVPAMPAFTEPEVEAMPLPGTSWEWVETKRTDGTGMTPVADQPFIISFNEDGNFTIDGDCNAMGSTYTQSANGNLTLAPIYSTKMFCEDSRETEFAADIATVSSYAIGENTLTLTTATGTMEFALVPEPR